MNHPEQNANAASSVPEASAHSGNDETVPGSHPPTGEPVEMPRFAPPTHANELGRLGKYRIQKELGRGGMGAVYLAFDERLQRKIALKVMLPKAAANVTAKERFLREARAAAQVSSDHVVFIHEADEIDGIPYISLQYLQGFPLDDYLNKHGNPDIPQIIRIGMETALGLEAAHQLGLVHRDIKPGNLWLEAPNGRVKILDFGLARQQADDIHLTRSGAVIGTPAYMSPEQGRGEGVDHRSDLFSLGGVLYRLCTGRLPFKGNTPMAILMSIGMDEPTPLRELNPAVPEPLANLIHRLLAKDPAGRPQSAKAVADELKAIFDRSQAPTALSASQPQVIYVPMMVPQQESQEPNPFAEITQSGVAAESAEEALPEAPSSRKPFPTMLVASLVFALVVVASVAFFLLNDSRKNTDTANNSPEPPPPPKTNLPKTTPPQPVKDPERIAAEYVLGLGGTVRLNEGADEIKTRAELPAEPFRLVHVNLNEIKEVTDSGLAVFKGCKNLCTLSMHDTPVTDAGLIHFKDSRNIVYLYLQQTQVSDAGLIHLKDCKGLQELNLCGTRVEGPGLVHFKDHPSLCYLYLQYAPITDAGLEPIKGLTKLQKLELQKTSVTPAGIELLAKALPECQILWDGGIIEPRKSPDRIAAEYTLSIGGTIQINEERRDIKDAGELPKEPFRLTSVNFEANKQVNDEGLANFRNCKNLTALNLRLTQVSDAGLIHFTDCNNLKTLSVARTKVSDAGMANFKDCNNLTHLYLGNTKVGDAGLAHFKNCKHLLMLDLSDTQASDAGLAHFKDCKNLVYLNLHTTQMSDAGLAHFKDCKNLTQLSLFKTQVGDAGLKELVDKMKLTELHIKTTKVTEAGVKQLSAALPQCKIEWDGGVIGPAKSPERIAAEWALSVKGHVRINDEKTDIKTVLALPKEPFRLTGVFFNSNRDVTDAGLAKLEDCTHLTELDLTFTQVGDVGIAHLKSLNKLTVLHLNNTGVTNMGLGVLKEFKNLTTLGVGNTQITDAGLANFKECKNLTKLYLHNLNVSDAGLGNFKDCKNLTTLDLKGTKVTEAGVKQLSAALPQCKIEWDGGTIEQ